MSFIQMGNAWRRSGGRQQEQADAEIRRRALEQGLEHQTWQRDQQVQSAERERAQAIVAERRRQESLRRRMALLRQRMPNASDDELMAAAEDDGVFGAYAKPQEAKNPIIGSPEWRDAQRFSAGLQDSNNERQAVRARETQGAAARVGNPTEGERKAGSQVRAAEASAETIERLKVRPSLGERLASKLPLIGNRATSERLQQMDQASRELAIAYLRVTSGATITPDEIDLTMKTMVPQANDKPATLAQKALTRRRMVQATRDAAGRAAPAATMQQKYNLAPVP